MYVVCAAFEVATCAYITIFFSVGGNVYVVLRCKCRIVPENAYVVDGKYFAEVDTDDFVVLEAAAPACGEVAVDSVTCVESRIFASCGFGVFVKGEIFTDYCAYAGDSMFAGCRVSERVGCAYADYVAYFVPESAQCGGNVFSEAAPVLTDAIVFSGVFSSAAVKV